ncbi:MAG: flagellar M-ring protein FliF C-terminal domain-containing protein [Lachnospiraceae bacterium]
MTERTKELQAKLIEWWNKFNSKQKTMIVSITAGVFIAFAVLIAMLTKPQYELLVVTDSTKESSAITELLDGSSISYKISTDGYRIEVLSSQEAQANLLLGANNIPTATYSIENVTSGGFSTTESDKKRLYKVYLEDLMRSHLESMSSIKSANVQLSIAEDNGTLIAQSVDSSAAIMLELEEDFSDENASSVAQFVRTALGNEKITNITIIDSYGNLLFSGDDTYSGIGSASSQLKVKSETESALHSNIRKILLGTKEYNLVEVSSNLQLDFTSKTITQHDYAPAEGSAQGVLSHESLYEAESTGGETSSVPGTDSNDSDNTSYVIGNGSTSSSTVTERSSDYLPNETITYTDIPAGLINYDGSSISVAAIKYRVVKEEEAKSQGLLDGVAWTDYKAQNNERIKLEVDEDIINMVATASGIAKENITIVAYEEPMFIDSDGLSVSVADILQIVLIVVIIGLLAFVVIRSMKVQKEEVEEEELSVESLLQSSPELELENITVEEKSETRKLIEKFVDDNPEAAASLLRNWLNEDWN